MYILYIKKNITAINIRQTLHTGPTFNNLNNTAMSRKACNLGRYWTHMGLPWWPNWVKLLRWISKKENMSLRGNALIKKKYPVRYSLRVDWKLSLRAFVFPWQWDTISPDGFKSLPSEGKCQSRQEGGTWLCTVLTTEDTSTLCSCTVRVCLQRDGGKM